MEMETKKLRRGINQRSSTRYCKPWMTLMANSALPSPLLRQAQGLKGACTDDGIKKRVFLSHHQYKHLSNPELASAKEIEEACTLLREFLFVSIV
jgi:hypothetical protein